VSDAQKWDRLHAAGDGSTPRAAAVLIEFAHLLPACGEALDLACGRGGNALLLAAAGLATGAWDISAVALAQLERHAAAAGVRIATACRDVVAAPPLRESADVIAVSHFLDRSLAPHLAAALRPGGLLYYQTFVRDAVDGTGPSNPAYRLGPNELLRLFAGLKVLAYREEGTVGDVARGFRNEAMLVAMRAA
jgi:SAM-dependent methyltransferase